MELRSEANKTGLKLGWGSKGKEKRGEDRVRKKERVEGEQK